jgi:hypothetical protein
MLLSSAGDNALRSLHFYALLLPLPLLLLLLLLLLLP